MRHLCDGGYAVFTRVGKFGLDSTLERDGNQFIGMEFQVTGLQVWKIVTLARITGSISIRGHRPDTAFTSRGKIRQYWRWRTARVTPTCFRRSTATVWAGQPDVIIETFRPVRLL